MIIPKLISIFYMGGGEHPDMGIIGLRDFDADGDTDLLWSRTSNSAKFVTLMAGGAPGPYQYVGGGGDPDMGIIAQELLHGGLWVE